ncbi:mannose-1-phosphate guanylyltransferase [Candidatus Shapirobacteria bacterium]|nr:mannose-1-phosphate guanylyltransferase [Candidatus Shapirobacteria bacterium]
METAKDNFKDHLFVLILCGGGGTRLWPRSRSKTPKQFIDLFGEKTIFAQTMERARSLTIEEHIFVSTNADYADEVIAQGKLPLRNIIAEPEKKNTALAMAGATAIISKIDPQAVIVNLPSDQLISPTEKFSQNLTRAAQAAFLGEYLVTVGIKPNFPHTGLGYIHVGQALAEFKENDVFKVKEFKEKPDLKTAQEFLKSGDYYWNAGMYIWSVESLMKACEKYAPRLFEEIKKIKDAWGEEDEQKVLNKVYAEAEDISIDYAISEKADNLALVAAEFSWSDIGDWKVVWDMGKKDKDGNMIVRLGEQGELLNLESTDSLIQFSDRLVAVVGVKDLIIIDTPDALLVCQKEKSQGVKKVVELLKEKGKKEYL